MKISEAWLREWADPPGGTEFLVRQLTMQGIEVEDVLPVGTPLDGVIVGRVTEVMSHPDADRLRICQVDAGAAVAQVVCGAANVRKGGLYPLATIGAQLPGGAKIKATIIRGVRSEGMLCSAAELGLVDTADGLLALGTDAVPGTSIRSVLQLDDQILDLNITPNRADCFCAIGIARDVAAAAGVAFRQAMFAAVAPQSSAAFSVVLGHPAACPRFAGRVVRNVDPQAMTPIWMRERLRRSGIRSISPVVDVTNYVMLELGQPLHAYDLDLLQGQIEVRLARHGERLGLLTGAEVEIGPDVLVIADNRGAIGLAGIMGGGSTAVTSSSRNIFLESAYFTPGAISGRARRYSLQTDASMRFERGVDPEQQVRALERATALLLEIAGGEPGPVSEKVATGTARTSAAVPLRRERLTRVLGVAVDDDVVESILQRLGMTVEKTAAGWNVQPPTFRFDITLEVDLIEEVARIHGYEHIPESQGMQATRLGEVSAVRVPPDRFRATLVDRGYQEAITYSFTDPDLDGLMWGDDQVLPLQNPISADLAVLRRSLWPGLMLALRHNLARQQRRVRLFECGVRFAGGVAEIWEEAVVAGVAAGAVLPEQWGASALPLDFFDIKADVEALLALGAGGSHGVSFTPAVHPALQPGRSARIARGTELVGWLGVLHPALMARLDLAEAPVLFELRCAPAFLAQRPAYQGLSRFPSVRRDLAFLVDRAVPVADLLAAVAEAAAPAYREAVVFDVYAGEGIDSGQKSVALGLILQETSRTLTDADIDRVVGSVVRRLARDFNATIRA